MLGSSWTDTPGLPNRHYLYTSFPTVVCSSPHSSPHRVCWQPARAEWRRDPSVVWSRQGLASGRLLTHEAAVLPACSSSPKALLPLVPWCWNLSPAHGTFHPQVTYSKSKPLDERLGFGYPRLVSMLCSKNGAGNSMWKKEGVRPGILAKCGLWDKSTREASQQAWSASFLLAKETGQVEVRSSLPIPLNLFS